MKNYLIYPFKKMKILQNYSGTTSHLPYSSGSPKDYPIDEAGADSGRDYMYCPCDKMTVKRLYGVGNSGTNTVWLTSANKVIFADGTEDYVTVMCIHPNDDDLKKLKVGQVFKRGEKMFREGTDGHATGNHIHFSVGKGEMKGTGWAKNSKGKWVLTTLGGPLKPERAFFVDRSFTEVLKDGGLKFKEVPKEKKFKVLKKTTIRKGAGTGFEAVGAYDAGEAITALDIVVNAKGNRWAHTDKGYVTYANLKEV